MGVGVPSETEDSLGVSTVSVSASMDVDPSTGETYASSVDPSVCAESDFIGPSITSEDGPGITIVTVSSGDGVTVGSGSGIGVGVGEGLGEGDGEGCEVSGVGVTSISISAPVSGVS